MLCQKLDRVQDSAFDVQMRARICYFNLSAAEATYVQNTRKERILKNLKTLSCWYSLDSFHGVLSDEYPYARGSVISDFLKSCCIGQISHYRVIPEVIVSQTGQIRTLGSNTKNLLQIPHTNMKRFGDRAFCAYATCLWNELPDNIMTADSVQNSMTINIWLLYIKCFWTL